MTQYNTPNVPAQWSDSRNTCPAVAMAIHAIADSSRTADDIWEEPTIAEFDHVIMAVEHYVDRGIFNATNQFWWGDLQVKI